jgi:hypothetical protein
MDVDKLIDAYVQEVAQLLPGKQRKDVALELYGLVCQELQLRAATQGRPLDPDTALEGLRAFGKPEDVAARYYEPWIIIPPTATRKFTFAALIGALVLIALSPLSNTPARSGQLAVAIFAWLGALLTYFAIQSLQDRRRNASNLWVPRPDGSVSRVGSLAIIVMICIGIVAYGAPNWLFSQFTQGRSLPAWLNYDPSFQSSRLPVLFFLWGCQAFLLSVLAIRGRWNPMLRRVDVCLEIGVALVLIWFLVAGPVFKEVVPNKVAMSAIDVCVLLLFVDVGIKLYREASRVRLPDELRSETRGAPG